MSRVSAMNHKIFSSKYQALGHATCGSFVSFLWAASVDISIQLDAMVFVLSWSDKLDEWLP